MLCSCQFVCSDAGSAITLETAMKSLLPEIFQHEPLNTGPIIVKEGDDGPIISGSADGGAKIIRNTGDYEVLGIVQQDEQRSMTSKIKLIRVQGIELDPQIPFHWVVNNLRHPEYYLHICVFVGTSVPIRLR